MNDDHVGSPIFLFELTPKRKTGGKRYAVLYCANGSVDEDHVVARLRAHFDTHIAPDRILLLGGEHIKKRLDAIAKSTRFARNLPSVTRYHETPDVGILTFDAKGAWTGDEDRTFINAMKRAGQLEIFRTRGGMMALGEGFHYIKPSTRHAQQFIRTANVLVASPEIDFLASCLLPWLPDTVANIYTDTASINSLAYSLIALRKELDPSFKAPVVDSFHSYFGLRAFAVDQPDRTLCLISASTSGQLEQDLDKLSEVPPNRIVTLYYCGVNPSRVVLCDITRTERQQDGLHEAIVSYDDDDCGLCQRSSVPLRISGDQFLTADMHQASVLLSATHAPEWLPDVIDNVASHSAFKCHHYSRERERHRPFYIDVAPLLDPDNGAPFRERLTTLLRHVLPACVDTIVYLNDSASRVMAEFVRDHHAEVSGQRIDDRHMVSAEKLTKNLEGFQPTDGTILVVASSVVTGRGLLIVSQALRKVHPLKPVVYLIGVGRMASKADWTSLKSNLSYGRHATEHPVHMALEMYLPDDRRPGKSAWTAERELLLDMRSKAEGDAAAIVNDRLRALNGEKEGTEAGLSDEVMLPAFKAVKAVKGKWRTEALKLRAGFAFWSEPETCEKASQADVIMTLATVLHNLRNETKSNVSLAQREHRHVVLAPTNFSRFNDAIVQAAFLRAALPQELDYRHDERSSAVMAEILRYVFQNLGHEEGEAAPEFLLALALRRLQLHPRETRTFCEWLLTLNLPPFLTLLAQHALEQVTTARFIPRNVPVIERRRAGAR